MYGGVSFDPSRFLNVLTPLFYLFPLWRKKISPTKLHEMGNLGNDIRGFQTVEKNYF